MARASQLMMLYTLMVLCGDDDGQVETKDDGSDEAAFLEQNKRLLACLVAVAYLSNFPAALKDAGFIR